MQIAVADASPLGRYLAGLCSWCMELDGQDAGESVGALLSQAPAATAPAQGRSRGWTLALAWTQMRESAQQWALNELLRQLRGLMPDLHDELQETSAPVVSSWLWHLIALARDTEMMMASFPLSAVLIAILLRLWIALCVLTGLLMALELLYQAMRLHFWLPTLSLRRAMDEYAAASTAFEDLYCSSLDLVKRAELATKGYRLGPRLPPLGRLENAATVRCDRIRLRLRWINEQMDMAASGSGTSQPEADGSEDVKQQSLPPSLLVTALSKRHALAALRIERVLFDAMHDAIAELLQTRPKGAKDSQEPRPLGLLFTMKRQEQMYRSLTNKVAVWTLALEPLVRPAMTLQATSKPDEALPVNERRGSQDVPKNVPAVRKSLQELRTACETLKALVFACQHDTEAFAVDPVMSREQWLQQLNEARTLMQKMVLQVNSSWSEYERIIDALGSKSSAAVDATDNASDASTNETPREGAPRPSPVDLALVKEELDITTVVFTGTSTGETDFDLMALLQRARQAPQNTAPDRSFVGELQDVLALRQRQAPAPVTKQVDQDQRPSPTGSSASMRAVDIEAKPVAEAPSADMFQQELMARLRLQPSESIGDSDDDAAAQEDSFVEWS